MSMGMLVSNLDYNPLGWLSTLTFIGGCNMSDKGASDIRRVFYWRAHIVDSSNDLVNSDMPAGKHMLGGWFSHSISRADTGCLRT